MPCRVRGGTWLASVLRAALRGDPSGSFVAVFPTRVFMYRPPARRPAVSVAAAILNLKFKLYLKVAVSYRWCQSHHHHHRPLRIPPTTTAATSSPSRPAPHGRQSFCILLGPSLFLPPFAPTLGGLSFMLWVGLVAAVQQRQRGPGSCAATIVAAFVVFWQVRPHALRRPTQSPRPGPLW